MYFSILIFYIFLTLFSISIVKVNSSVFLHSYLLHISYVFVEQYSEILVLFMFCLVYNTVWCGTYF